MFRTLGWLAALALLLLAASSAAAEVKTRMITFKAGDEEVKGFLAEPTGKGPYPAIVVIQEWWGLSDWIKNNAKRLAEQGYVCLAPDLYRGKVTTEMRVARELMMGLSNDRALRVLKGAVSSLAARDNVDKDRLGSIGWCMGGGYSLQLAIHDSRIKACAMCYGRVVTDADKLKSLKATVLGVFGEEDGGIPPAQVQKFEKALKEAGKKVYRIEEFKAGHGFMRPPSISQKNDAFVPKEAKRAWQDVDIFFATTLKGK
jgi:carboxymethylenebutenolidase